MNVTPAEFHEIWGWWNDPGIREADAVHMMCMYYGCRRYGRYRLVVNPTVPAIPWYSWGVKRFEEET